MAHFNIMHSPNHLGQMYLSKLVETCLTESAALLTFTERKPSILMQDQLNIGTRKELNLRMQLLEALYTVLARLWMQTKASAWWISQEGSMCIRSTK